MSHKQWHSISSTQKQTKFEKPPNKAREKSNSLSLEAYDLYIFLPLWQQVTKKFLDAQAWSSCGGGVRITPRTKASVDAEVDTGVGADGVGAGASCAEAVAGADEVALVSVTGTAADL